MNKQTRTHPWVALLGIALASFLGCIDFTIVNTALPTIQAELHTTVVQLQWIINIFLIVMATAMVISCRLADIYGRRLVLYAGMVLFALSSLGAGLSNTIHLLIFFRLIQGIAVAILYTVPMAIIHALFPPKNHGKATGLLIGVNGLGLAIGPVVGGIILGLLSWRWIFFVNPLLIILSFALCWKNLPESKSNNPEEKIDWWGFLLLAISLPLLILATVNGESWGWLSTQTLSFYAAAIVGLLLFYWVEKRTTQPMIQFNLFANRQFITGVIAFSALAFFYSIAFFLMPLYLHNILGKGGYSIGLSLLPATLMVAVLSPIVGRIIDKKGTKNLLLVGFALFALSALLQMYFVVQTSNLFIFFAFILFGIGWACILSPGIMTAVSAVPPNYTGVAIGSLGTLHNFAGALGLALGTALYHYQAKTSLIKLAVENNIVSGDWIKQAIADPDNAIQIIQQNTTVNAHTAQSLFQNFFLQGYHSVMGLLLAVSLGTIITVWMGLKSKKN